MRGIKNKIFLKEIEKLKQGDHLCIIYKDFDDQMMTIIPYLTFGLERNEKCFYIVDENSVTQIVDKFKEYKIDIEKYLSENKMNFLTKEEAYLKNGYFDPDEMITLLRETQDAAIREGFKGIRVTGEMTWVFTKLPGVDSLIEYEAKLNAFFPSSKSLAICQYNEVRFDKNILLDVIHTHPKVVIDSHVIDNCYFIPVDEFLLKQEGKPRETVYNRVKQDLIGRAMLEEENRKKTEELNRMLKDLENFQEMAINREFRMAELKDEINKLSIDLGRKPKY